MISDNLRNLFKFIEFLHENIKNFMLFDKDIQKMLEAFKEQGQLPNIHIYKVEKKRLAKTISEKQKRISKYVLIPLESRVNELGDYVWNDPNKISVLYKQDVQMLYYKLINDKISENEENEIIEVKRSFLIIKNKFNEYIQQNGCFDFLNQINSILETLEYVMKPITRHFYEEGDKEITKRESRVMLELEQANNNVKPYTNNQMEQISKFLNEVQSIDVTLEKRYLVENMYHLKEEDVPKETRKHLKSKKLYVVNKCSEGTIRTLYNNAKLSLVSLSDKELKKVLKILLDYSYEYFNKAYTTYYKMLTKGEAQPMHDADFLYSLQGRLKNNVENFGLFTMEFLHDLMDDVSIKRGYLFSLTQDVKKLLGMNDEDITPEKLSSTTELQSETKEPLTVKNNIEAIKESDNENNIGVSDKIKPLFNFIDFLHTNIDNINQNMSVVLEWKKARWQERQFRQHYTEKLKMREVQKKIRAKEAEVSDQLIEPIKEKAIEIDVSILDNPKSIYTNFSHHIVMLQENFHQEDVEEIIKVKRQYIEIRNDINPHILLLLKDFFNYFDELMKHLVAFFKEDGDKTIPRILDIYLDDYFNTPVSFELPLTDVQIKNFYDSLLIKHQEVICEDTDFDYFSYAISGNEIPLEKTSYKPVMLRGTIDSMYYELLELMKSCGVIPNERKTIPPVYVQRAEELFINKNGNPLKLRTPK